MIYRTYQTEAAGSDLHLDVPLSNFAVKAFGAAGEGLIGNQIFPSVPVGKQSDKYYIIDRGAFLRNPGEDSLRAPATPPVRVRFEISSESYFCDNFALAGEIPLEDLANADMAIMLRENTVEQVVGLLRLDEEIRIANLITSGGNVGSGATITGANQWTDPNSDPVGQVNTGHAFIQNNTGLVANTMAMSWNTFQVVRRHPLLLDLYKHVALTDGQLNTAQIAASFNVQRLLVGTAIRNSGIEGATDSFAQVWGDHVFLGHVSPAVGRMSRTVGLRFRWRPDIFPADFGVRTNREDRAGERQVEVVDAGYYQDEKVVARELGYVLSDVI